MRVFAASTLTDDNEGETPLIPAPIMHYSIRVSHSVDLQQTLKTLTSLTTSLAVRAGDDRTDPVVR